jgi:O-antigen ligase
MRLKHTPPPTMSGNWQFLYLCLLGAFIPYGITYAPYIFIGVFLWFYFGEFKKIKFPKTGLFILFFCFFILHCIGILYSNNKSMAINPALTKIGFVFFPILLNTYTLNNVEFRKILHVFCFSNIIVAVLLITRALASSIFFHSPLYTYSLFSWFIHPSYCAFYMVFSIAILYLTEFKTAKSPQNDLLIKLVFTTLLVIAILFCSSKMGVITLALTVLFLSIYFMVKLKSFFYSFFFILLLSGICFIFVVYIPSPIQRLNAMVNDYTTTQKIGYSDLHDFNKQTLSKGLNQRESGLARIFIWNAVKPVIKKHLLFGVGTGDVINSMVISAQDEGLDTINNKFIPEPQENLFLYGVYRAPNYNMHNQFIETQMGLGLPGTVVLWLLTFGTLIFSFLKRNLLLSIFTCLIILNFFVESMFQWDYFCLFYSLFLYMFIEAKENKYRPLIYSENKTDSA